MKTHSTLRRIFCLTWIIAGLTFGTYPALAQETNAPAQKTIGATKTEIVPSLIVMNAQGASLQGETGHMLTTLLLAGWSGASEGFAKDPPNATVSVFSKDAATVHDAVVVLKAPKLEGDRLTFAVQVLEGDLAGADGPASVFIDTADFEVNELQSMFPSTNWPSSMRR
jgi:hypothetical protein